MADSQLSGSVIHFGVFEVDSRTGELRKQGIKIRLREQPFQILALLLENPGRVVTRDELQKKLWSSDTFVDFDRGLNRAVNQLRAALGDSADTPRFIETLPKRGYRFVAPVSNSGTAEPESPVLEQATAVRRSPRSGLLPWAMTGLFALAATAMGVLLWRTTRPVERPMMRFSVDLGPDAVWGRATMGTFLVPKISPDGTRILFPVKGEGGRSRLALRLLDQPSASMLAGTDGAEDPFFSPDGHWIGFFADQKIKKVPVQGGEIMTLCNTPGAARGGDWGEDGTIIANLDFFHLFRVPSGGGQPVIVGRPEEIKERSWRYPQILPGGDKVLFTGSAGAGSVANDNANLEVLDLRSGQTKIVQRSGYFARYVPSGHLLYIHNGTLLGVPFDLSRLEARGAPTPIFDDLADSPGTAAGRFDFSQTGTLVYLASRGNLSQTSWLDTTGKLQPIVNTQEQAETPRLSPDGKRLALTVAGDLTIYDLQRGTTIKLTSNAALNRHPAWMPDSKHIIFASDVASPSGDYGIWWVRADGSSKPELLFADKTPLQTFSISPDGQRLAFLRTDSELNFVIWLLKLDLSDPDHPKPGTPELFMRESRGQVDPSFSPDGRWIAYVTANPSLNGLGGEVMVRQFNSTSPDSRWQVSNGGKFPIWSRNGRELFYLGTDNRIMVVGYTTRGDSFIAEKPQLWSPAPLFRPANASLWNFDLSPDGKHSVILATPESGGGNVHATVLLNFFDELRRRIPVRK